MGKKIRRLQTCLAYFHGYGQNPQAFNADKVQLIFAGKFHPDDAMGREMFNNILHKSYNIKNVAVLAGYELELSAKLKRATDVWLNTPIRPLEASGTSGMSANMNGALHLSIYDGWTVEGTFPGINGYTVEYPGLDDDIPWEETTGIFRIVKYLFNRSKVALAPPRRQTATEAPAL